MPDVFSSVTRVMRFLPVFKCRCEALAELVNDAASPIKFDKETSEYRLYYDSAKPSLGFHVIAYCIFCGGRVGKHAPSKLSVIPRQEEARLSAMVSPLRSSSDVQLVLGLPDDETIGSLRAGLADRKSQETEFVRILTYRHLSSFANLMVFERKDGSIGFSIIGKTEEMVQ